MYFLLSLAAAETWQIIEIEELDTQNTGEMVSLGTVDLTTHTFPPDVVASEAFRVTPSGFVPLKLGEEIAADTELVTWHANVTLHREADDATIVMYEDSHIKVEDWGVMQDAGAVLYQLHHAFRVWYHRYEVIVEGTEFIVETDEMGEGGVAVRRGRVRLRSPYGEVPVRKGKIARTGPGHPPELTDWHAPVQIPVSVLTDFIPRPSLGILGGGRYEPSGAGGQGAFQIRGELPLGPVRLNLATGVGGGKAGGILPFSFGVQTNLGMFSAGGSLHALVEVTQESAPPGQQGAWGLTVRPGGSADLAFQLPVGQHLAVSGQFQLGFADGLFVTGAAGAAWRF